MTSTPTSSTTSSQLPKKPTTASTPIRQGTNNNNYAAPETPIASVKRPRSSMLSPGAGGKGVPPSSSTSSFDQSGKPPPSATKAGSTPRPHTSGLPMTPLDSNANANNDGSNSSSNADVCTPKTPTPNRGRGSRDDGEDDVEETMALMSPIHGVKEDQVTSWGTASFAELNNSNTSCATPANEESSSSGKWKVAMSPMHPPKPLVNRGADHKVSVSGAVEAAAAIDLEGSNSSDGASSWVGRQVDALFSPVLNLFQGDDEDNDEAEETDDAVPVKPSTSGDVTMPDASKTTDANSNATVPTTTSEDDDVLHNPDEEYPSPAETGDPIDHNQVVDDEEDADDSAHHRHHHQHHHQDEEAEEDYSEEEDEFNPYVFIKSLPPYEHVAHARPPIALPPKKADSPPISLVLDLDETLVHCTVEPVDDADLVFPVVFHGMTYQVHVRLRPHLFTFLEKIQDKYEVIVFTASQKVYANELLNLIDPDGKYIHYRMFRESCLAVEGNFLKDLTVLGRDLSQAVLVDNSPHAFGYQVDNGIPIESWFDDPNDTELLKLERFLRTLHGSPDVRNVVRNKFQTYRLVREA